MSVLKSMEKQFALVGLHIRFASDTSVSLVATHNWEIHWNFEQIRFLKSLTATDFGKPSRAGTDCSFLL
jgi:hypothetical protein